jgi:hypothetical protein
MNGVEDPEWPSSLATLPNLDEMKAEQSPEEE